MAIQLCDLCLGIEAPWAIKFEFMCHWWLRVCGAIGEMSGWLSLIGTWSGCAPIGAGSALGVAWAEHGVPIHRAMQETGVCISLHP